MTWRRWSLVVVAVAYIGAVGAGARYLEELRIGGGYGETVDGGMDIDHEGNLWTDGTIYYDVEDLSTGGAAGTVPMSDGDGTLTMVVVDTADIPDTEAELELHLTDVTDVVTNNDAYYQYFIDGAGTTGQVWTSDGSGKGGWSTLSAATDLLVSADNYVPPLGYNYERNDYLYIRGGTGITTSIDDVLSGPRITISRSAASWAAAADSGTNQTIAESGTITLSGSTTAATKGIATSTDTGKVVFALPTGSSGQVLKHDGTAWAAGTDTTGGTMSSFNFGVSGHMIPVVNGYNVYCYGLRGITVETISGTWGIFNIGLPTATTSGQVLKWDGSAWVAGTDSGTTYTAGTGLNLSGTTFSLQHLGWESLTDPNADRVGFWDDSAGAMKWLSIGSNLSISGTTIAATNTTYTAGNGLKLTGTKFALADGASSGQIWKWDGDSWELSTDAGTTYTAGTGLNLSGTTFSLQHLGWESLADPNADRVGFWDDSAGAMKWLTIGSNLSITDTTIAATDTNTTYSAFVGDSGAGGAAGLVPAPGAGDAAAGKYLKADGTWATVSSGSSLPSGAEHQTLRYDDPNGWEAAANLTNTGVYVTVIGTGADVQPLDINHATNAAADSEVHISFSSSDPDGNATPTIGTVGFEIEAVDATDILDADFVVKNKQAGGASTERFRVADTTLTDASGMLKQNAIEQNSATTGQALKWNGSAWAPDDDDIGGGTLPSGTSNYTMKYNGTSSEWEATGKLTVNNEVVEVNGDYSSSLKIKNSRNDVGEVSGMRISTTSGANQINSLISHIVTSNTTDAESADIYFRATDAGSVAEKLRIKSNGNLDIAGAIIAGSADTTLTDASGMLKQNAIEQNSATTGQALKWNGSAWAPANDVDTTGSFTVAGDSGSSQTISNGDTLTISGGGGLTTTSGATDKVTVNLPSGSSGQVLKHNGTAWAAGADTTGGTMSSFNFGVSGHMIPVVNGYNVYCYGLRGITVETISGTWGIFNIGLPTATTSGQVLKWDGSAWVAGTDSGTTYTAGTGLNLSGTTFSLQHLGWESLADPNADRVGFWDDSAGAMKWLTIGSNLSITDTTIAATDTNTTYSAGNGLKLSSTTFALTDGSTSGQILKWDGDSWELASDETGSPGSMTFTLAGDSGSSQTIADTNTMSVLGGRGLSTVASATDTITVNLPTGSNGQVLKSNGTTWSAGTDNDTTYSAFTGDSGSGGAAGLVPAPGAGDAAAGKYLKADGTWATVSSGSSLPSGTEHQTLRHNGTAWAATSGMLSTGTQVTITGYSQQACVPLKVLTPRDNVNDISEIEFGTSQPNGENNNPYGCIGIKITDNSQYSRDGTIMIRPGYNSALANGISVTGTDSTIHGVLKAGSTPTTVTNSSGKVLMAALEKITYNTQWLQGNTYIWNSSNFTAGTGGADENDLGGRYLQQTSTGADAYAWAWVNVPSDFTSGDSVKLTAYFTADTTDTNAMYVGLAATYIADAGAVLASSGATPQYSAVTLASTGLKSATYTYSSFSATAGGLVAINLHRDDDHGSDTSTNKMRFFGMSVEFER